MHHSTNCTNFGRVSALHQPNGKADSIVPTDVTVDYSDLWEESHKILDQEELFGIHNSLVGGES
jgi:hypothetical protein